MNQPNTDARLARLETLIESLGSGVQKMQLSIETMAQAISKMDRFEHQLEKVDAQIERVWVSMGRRDDNYDLAMNAVNTLEKLMMTKAQEMERQAREDLEVVKTDLDQLRNKYTTLNSYVTSRFWVIATISGFCALIGGWLIPAIFGALFR